MPMVRHTLELDAETDARLKSLSAERGQDVASVIADAIALLASAIDVEGPDIAEDIRRLEEFERTGEAISGEEFMAWVESWDTDNELPPPKPRKII